MSDYSDCYYEVNKEFFERETIANKYKDRMKDELPINTMIRIMFTDFLAHKSNSDVIDLAEKHLM